jgi:hypothetical protein
MFPKFISPEKRPYQGRLQPSGCGGRLSADIAGLLPTTSASTPSGFEKVPATPSLALRAPSPPMGARELAIMFTSPSPQWGEGSCERIQFLLPSLVRRGSGGGRKSRYTNPLKSPLTKGDTRKVIPKPIFSQLQGPGVKGLLLSAQAQD